MKSNFGLQTAKLVGTPSGSTWSQTHCFTPEDIFKKEKRGTLLAVLVLEGLGEGVEAVATGREVLGRLHEEYYGNLEGLAFNRLGEAVEKVCLEQKGVSIVAATILNNQAFLAIFGQGKILFKRKETLGVLLKGEGELVTASGEIFDQDLIFLGSEMFFKAVGEKALKSALQTNQPEQIMEFLTPDLLSDSQVPGIAAITALFEKEVLEEQPEEEIVLPKTQVEPMFETQNRPRKIFVHNRDFSTKKKLYFGLSLILLSILGLSFVFGIRKSLQAKKTTQVKEIVSLATEKLSQAKEVFVTQPDQARQLASEAGQTITQAIEILPENKEALSLQDQINQFLYLSQQEIAFDKLTVFMDLNLILDGAKGESLVLLAKNLAILDSAKKKVYLLDYEKKANQIINFDSESAQYLSGFEDKLMVYSPSGVEEINLSSKASKSIIKKDSDWGEIVGITSFNTNLYLLDSGNSDLWRYLSVNGYSSKKGWFIGTAPDLSQAVDLAIDGMVWVLTPQTILKLNLGQEENFSLTKTSQAFEKPIKIKTSEATNNLYVLDQGRGKIDVFNKNGEFQISYKAEELKTASDFVVLEEQKKIFALSMDKIFEIRMK